MATTKHKYKCPDTGLIFNDVVIAHIRAKFNGRLDDACKECGLSLTAATIEQMTSDQFITLMDKKKEWRL